MDETEEGTAGEPEPPGKPRADEATPESEEFGAQLRTQFNRLGISVRQYARTHAWDHTSLSRFFNGRRVPEWNFVTRLFEHLEAAGEPVSDEDRNRLATLHAAAARSKGGVIEDLRAANERLIEDLRRANKTIGLALLLIRQQTTEKHRLIQEIESVVQALHLASQESADWKHQTAIFLRERDEAVRQREHLSEQNSELRDELHQLHQKLRDAESAVPDEAVVAEALKVVEEAQRRYTRLQKTLDSVLFPWLYAWWIREESVLRKIRDFAFMGLLPLLAVTVAVGYAVLWVSPRSRSGIVAWAPAGRSAIDVGIWGAAGLAVAGLILGAGYLFFGLLKAAWPVSALLGAVLCATPVLNKERAHASIDWRPVTASVSNCYWKTGSNNNWGADDRSGWVCTLTWSLNGKQRHLQAAVDGGPSGPISATATVRYDTHNPDSATVDGAYSGPWYSLLDLFPALASLGLAAAALLGVWRIVIDWPSLLAGLPKAWRDLTRRPIYRYRTRRSLRRSKRRSDRSGAPTKVV